MSRRGNEKGIRTFIAIELPDDTINEVSAILGYLKEKYPSVKWVRPETIHLTLAFIGNIGPEKVALIAETMEEIRGESFCIKPAEIGAFPDIKRPRVIWLGIKGETEKLAALQHNVIKVCQGLGECLEEKSFSPHLTLGRVKGPVKGEHQTLANLAEDVKLPEFKSFRVEAFYLYQSILRPSGAEHRKIKKFNLRGFVQEEI